MDSSTLIQGGIRRDGTGADPGVWGLWRLSAPLSPDMLASLMIFAPPEQEKKVSKGGGGEGKRAEKANTRFCNLVGGKHFWTKTITRNNRKIKIAESPIAFVE